MGFRTRQIHAGVTPDPITGSILTPIYQSTTYVQPSVDEYLSKGFTYSRSGNPTVKALETKIADLEGGVDCACFGTGMSAVLATMLAFLEAGAHAIVSDVAYGGTYRLSTKILSRFGIDYTFADTADPDAVAAAVRDNTKLIFTETPANPTMKCSDIAAISEIATKAGAVHVVDNTFLSPAGQRPFALGADIVLHSTTKYINGHSDVVGGAVLARSEALVEELTWWANCLGLTGSPFDSYQTLRGLRTLSVRYRQHEENAAAVADFLERQQMVRKVYYPGLRSHNGHGLAKRQQQSFGAMISFEIAADVEEIGVFLGNLRLFTLAESLGGVESLVAHPASMTHAAMSREDQAAAGIKPSLLRLSVGIEHVDDLLADLEAGFEALRLHRKSSDVRSVA